MGSQRPKGGQKRRATKGRNGQRKKENQTRQTDVQKEEEEKGKTGKKIGLKKTPSQLILAQVKCIWLAVDLALEDCGKSVLKNSNIGNSQIIPTDLCVFC